MLAIPSSQMGWRAKRTTSQRSKSDVSVLMVFAGMSGGGR